MEKVKSGKYIGVESRFIAFFSFRYDALVGHRGWNHRHALSISSLIKQ